MGYDTANSKASTNTTTNTTVSKTAPNAFATYAKVIQAQTKKLKNPEVSEPKTFETEISNIFGQYELPTTYADYNPYWYNNTPTLSKLQSQQSEYDKEIGNKNLYSNTAPSLISTNFYNKSNSLLEHASQYVGIVNSDAEGNRLFSPNGASQHWCADFVSYNIRSVYGNILPNGHCSSVNGLRDWGIEEGTYMPKPENINERSSWICANVKPGDIMIEKDGGKSHTGIVEEIHEDGSFTVVEGNCSNAVKRRTYPPSSRTLTGFVSMNKYRSADLDQLA